MISCYACGHRFEPPSPLTRRDECPSCGRDLHCCRNCRFYDPAVNNQCREPQAEWVADREKANFCDYFQPASRDVVTAPTAPAADARARFNALFRVEPEASNQRGKT